MIWFEQAFDDIFKVQMKAYGVRDEENRWLENNHPTSHVRIQYGDKEVTVSKGLYSQASIQNSNQWPVLNVVQIHEDCLKYLIL